MIERNDNSGRDGLNLWRCDSKIRVQLKKKIYEDIPQVVDRGSQLEDGCVCVWMSCHNTENLTLDHVTASVFGEYSLYVTSLVDFEKRVGAL